MPSIPANQARGLFTSMLIATFVERPIAKKFLQSFFTTKSVATRYLNIEVMRGTERVAVDVLRGADGNRNVFAKSTEKIIEPPYYREYFDATELDVYDRMFGTESIDMGVFATFLSTVADKLAILTDKIVRAIELQCSQVLETGIITLTDGTAINFGRKAGSLVDNSSIPWTTGTNDPYVQLATGAQWLRTNGKAAGGLFNVILGDQAYSGLINNTIVKARGPLSNINFDALQAPQREAVGQNYVGRISGGSYQFDLWTYSEVYEKESSFGSKSYTYTSYINPKKAIILPQNPNFILGYGLVPQLIDLEHPKAEVGPFVYGDYRDPKHHTHEYDVRSAPVAIPVAVDQMYTVQVIA